MLRCYENNSRAYSQSHELCLEEWENGQRANSCCYRSHSGLLNTVMGHGSRVMSSGRIYATFKENNSGYSSIPDDSRKEWENEQRANSCCYRSHSGLLNTVTSNKLQVTSKSVSTCQRINVSTLKPLHVTRNTLHVLEKHEA